MTDHDTGDPLERLMALWQQTPVDDEVATQAFAEFYTYPVRINGTSLTCADLVVRARALQAAFADLRHELLERVEVDDKLVIAFLLHGTHVGPWATPLGDVPPTGRTIAVRTIDVLTRTDDGRIGDVVVVNDEFGLLTGLGALTLA